MELDPFVAEVEGCVAVGGLPEERRGFFGRFLVGIFRFLCGRWRGEEHGIVEVHVR